MSRGRKPATGRYDTRAELVAEVWRRWRDTPANVADIARAVRVSEGVAHRILNLKEGMPT